MKKESASGFFFSWCLFSHLFCFFHQFDDLVIAGSDFLHGHIMIDNVDDTCQIFAHIRLNIVRFCQKFRVTVVQVRGDYLVDVSLLIILIKLIQTVSEQTISGADKYTFCVALL